MKKYFKLGLLVVLAVMLIGGTAVATPITLTIPDTVNYWPGHPSGIPSIDNTDLLGSSPIVGDMRITYDDTTRVLQSIAIDVQFRHIVDALFINNDWNGRSSDLESWNFLAEGDLGHYPAQLYFVPDSYTYLISPSDRPNQPVGIENFFLLTPAPNRLSSVDYASNILTYNFAGSIPIVLGTNFVIAYTEDCGNDVHYTAVPEPSVLLLLGAGLIGLTCLRRKR